MWCDKAVVDEAHNLIKPSEDKFKNPRSVENLRYAREALAAIRTVLVLFTATPMVDSLTTSTRCWPLSKARATSG